MKGSSSTIRIRVSILQPRNRSMMQRQGEHERRRAVGCGVALVETAAMECHDTFGERPLEARGRGLEPGPAEATLDTEDGLDRVRARLETHVHAAAGRGALDHAAPDGQED